MPVPLDKIKTVDRPAAATAGQIVQHLGGTVDERLREMVSAVR